MNIHDPTQTALSEKHAELLLDIESVADRANKARRLLNRDDVENVVKSAEAALIRVHDAWRKSRGGRQNNLFFEPLSHRLRRIIAFYRKPSGIRVKPPEGSERWRYRIVNYEEIPFHRLRPYFRASAVDEAIRTGILLGLRELGGVTIYQEQIDE